MSLKRAKAYATALAKGDPDALGVIKSSLREVLS